MRKSAHVSDCGQYRYHLVRQWNESLPPLVFIMLNPSTADADKDDATIRKCIGFARRLGFGGVEIFNLFAYRTRDPRVLKMNGWLVGAGNDYLTSKRLHQLEPEYVMAAWGTNAKYRACRARAGEMLRLVVGCGVQVRALRETVDGFPAHPLMLPYDCTPVSYP